MAKIITEEEYKQQQIVKKRRAKLLKVFFIISIVINVALIITICIGAVTYENIISDYDEEMSDLVDDCLD